MNGARSAPRSTIWMTLTDGGSARGSRAIHSNAHLPYFEPSLATSTCIASPRFLFRFAGAALCKPLGERRGGQVHERRMAAQSSRIVEVVVIQPDHILPGNLIGLRLCVHHPYFRPSG